jgi:hypothetical protein
VTVGGMGLVTALSAAGLSAALAFTVAPTASASSPGIPDDGVLHQRLEHFCTRVPHLVERGGKLQPKLAAGADTKGSLKFLQARIDKAEQEKRTAAARRLERRLERRTKLAQKLPERLENLKQAQSECTAAGLGTSK